MEDAKTVHNDEADTLTQKPVEFYVDILNKTKFQRLLKQPDKKLFKIYPAVTGTLVRISKELLSLPEAINPNDINAVYDSMNKHGLTMAKIIAIAVSNSEKEPSDDLIKFFLYNLTAKELKTLVNIVLKQMDVINFITSIVLVKGANILTKTSL